MTERIINISPNIYRKADIGVQRLVIDQEMHHGAVRRASTNDYFLVYSQQRGCYADEQGEAMHPAHSWICWGPEHAHVYGHDERPWLHSCFHVHGDGARRLFQQILTQPRWPHQQSSRLCIRTRIIIHMPQPIRVLRRNTHLPPACKALSCSVAKNRPHTFRRICSIPGAF